MDLTLRYKLDSLLDYLAELESALVAFPAAWTAGCCSSRQPGPARPGGRRHPAARSQSSGRNRSRAADRGPDRRGTPDRGFFAAGLRIRGGQRAGPMLLLQEGRFRGLEGPGRRTRSGACPGRVSRSETRVRTGLANGPWSKQALLRPAQGRGPGQTRNPSTCSILTGSPIGTGLRPPAWPPRFPYGTRLAPRPGPPGLPGRGNP